MIIFNMFFPLHYTRNDSVNIIDTFVSLYMILNLEKIYEYGLKTQLT